MTCIMQRPATSQRHKAWRVSWRLPPKEKASEAGSNSYPRASGAAIQMDGSVCAADQVMLACPLAALPRADTTPFTASSVCSRVSEQAAQTMPRTTTWDSHRSETFPGNTVDGLAGRLNADHSSGSSKTVR